MDWQDYIVWIIVGAIALLLLRRLGCRIAGRRSGNCSSCDAAHCPLKKEK